MNKNINIINENRNLKLQIMTLKDEINQIKNMYNLQLEEEQSLKKQAELIYRLIVDESYAKQQLGKSQSKLLGKELFNRAIENYKQQNLRSRDLLVDLTNSLKDKDLEIEGLKSQISMYLIKEEQTKMVSQEQSEFFNPETAKSFINGEKTNELKETIKVDTPIVKAIIDENLDTSKCNIEDKEEIKKVKNHTNNNDLKIEKIIAKPLDNNNTFNKKSNNNFNKNNKSNDNNFNKTNRSNDKNFNKNNNNFNKTNSSNNFNKKNNNTNVANNKLNKKNSFNPNNNFTKNNNEVSSDDNKVNVSDTKKNLINDSSRTTINTNELYNKEIKAHVINLQDYANQCNNIMWLILDLIGKEGISVSPDIRERVVNPNITNPAFNLALNNLNKMNLIKQEKINTGWRWFYIYELSSLGISLFFDKYKKKPIVCEKQQIKKDHTTALHGYCIKDTMYILKSILGYETVNMSRKTNSLNLYDGKTYIPDIIATKNKRTIIDYFEVELGHHTQVDFNEKCNKMRMVTQNLYFIVPNATVMNKVLAKQIAQWVISKGGKDKLQGLNIYLTTLTKLTSAKWEIEYKF